MSQGKINLAVLMGGCSPEHEISLMSAKSVVSNLDSKKYNIYVIAIDKTGHWYLMNTNDLFSDVKDPRSLSLNFDSTHKVSLSPGRPVFTVPKLNKEILIDIVFPVLHGAFGEDGKIQGLLENLLFPMLDAGFGL